MGETAIPEADFYDCRDSSALTHESPEEAVEELLDLWMDVKSHPAEVIKEHSPITVSLYRRKEMDIHWLTVTAESLIDRAVENWAEEFCQGDDAGTCDIAEVQAKKALPAMLRALGILFKGATPYDCEKFDSVKLGAETVEAMMREHREDWFEEPPP
jgi:hypothetical protein